ncbi:beta-hydroxylase [Pseudoxanthomonas jiangsuensis]|uniref:aspartyl/asparaginyl beta-hydroxylase domain-containing protein n=1 Tax=Pseudoxanthomonas jiangsuensis TaxID=619688 RepID=UPI0013908598|nr:aspartyl/asparaginyl beta-hydroxylase domain-containing protein [Pseudoxanthomonas jiangsuensis]KAF1695794.1 beta-hydroxylase [Pseudoxanthomonas jiangsuensis]
MTTTLHLLQMRASLQAGNPAQALREADLGLAAEPESLELELGAVDSLILLQRHGEAMARLERLLQTRPDSGEAWFRLGICRLRMSGDEPARAAFERSTELLPDAFHIRLHLAEALQALGRHPEALVQFFRAVTGAQAKGRWLDDGSTAPALRDRVRQAMRVIDVGRPELFFGAIEPLIKEYGLDELVRVRRALEGYLGLAPLQSPDPRQRPTFFYVPDLQPEPYFARELFPWYEALESAFDGIRADLQRVLGEREGLQPFLDFSKGARKDDYLGSRGDLDAAAWDAYFFYRHGQEFGERLQACPATAAALTQVPLTRIDAHAPEVLFSLLSPGTVIKPHHGVTNTRVVTHLPLIVPPDCALEVGGDVHEWQEGRCVTFDDSFLHQAWNHSDRLRVVMILDTWHPRLRPAEVLAIRRLVESIGDFNRQAGVD